MNYSLLVGNDGSYTVSSDYSTLYATLESNGALLIRSWFDNPPYFTLKGAVRFLINNTDKEIEVFPGPTGFWQSIGFTLIDKESNKWRYQR